MLHLNDKDQLMDSEWDVRTQTFSLKIYRKPCIQLPNIRKRKHKQLNNYNLLSLYEKRLYTIREREKSIAIKNEMSQIHYISI